MKDFYKEITDEHFNDMILYSLRYCITRNSYAVGSMIEILNEHWSEINNNLKVRCIKDILEEMNGSRMDCISKDSWKEFIYSKMKEERDKNYGTLIYWNSNMVNPKDILKYIIN